MLRSYNVLTQSSICLDHTGMNLTEAHSLVTKLRPLLLLENSGF